MKSQVDKKKASAVRRKANAIVEASQTSITITDTYLKQLNVYAAGIDIGSRSHFVAAPVLKDGNMVTLVREFSVLTPDLERLADWLKECNVTSVAMESTSVYWIPLYELLEARGFDVNLVDARHVKNVTGRKTDVVDAQWLQQLHACGLLSGAFRPKDEILPLRSYTRQRDRLVASQTQAIQHMQKALTQMNLHLSNVLNTIACATGMTIIRAIVAGERDPKILAKHRDIRCKSSQDLIEQSLTGHYRSEHLFALQQALESYDFYQKQIVNCDRQIAHALNQLNPESSSDKGGDKKTVLPRTHRSKKGNDLCFDPTEDLQALAGVDLTKIPGIGAHTAVKLISETGTDMTPWQDEKHFTSWLGLSPENKVSGGKRLSSRTRSSANRAAGFFRLSAYAIARTQTALGAFHRRIKSKHGAAKAITATARKIAVIFYKMLTQGTEYVEAGIRYYEEKYKARLVKGIQKKAEALGYTLVLQVPLIESALKADKK